MAHAKSITGSPPLWGTAVAAFPVFCNRARIGHIFPGVQRTGKAKSSRKPPFSTGYLCPNRTQSPLLEWLRPPGLYAYAHIHPLARLAVSGYSRCAAAEPVNAARIAAACGGWAFRPRDMPASRARRCAHNASGPVDFLPKKFAAVCERGSPPSCKHPISFTPIGGGGAFRRGEKNSHEGGRPVWGRGNPDFDTPGERFASLIRAGAPPCYARTRPRPRHHSRLHKQTRFFCVETLRFRFTIAPLCCVFYRLSVLYPVKNRP